MRKCNYAIIDGCMLLNKSPTMMCLAEKKKKKKNYITSVSLNELNRELLWCDCFGQIACLPLERMVWGHAQIDCSVLSPCVNNVNQQGWTLTLCK